MTGAHAVQSKLCALCGATYASDAQFCAADGTALDTARAVGAGDAGYTGTVIAQHIEVRELVGTGAMGKVYRAFQRGIDRDVAVKILHRELSLNEQLVARFTREAKVASKLQHPHVVEVLLSGQLDDGALYIVMEFLKGTLVQDVLDGQGGPLPLERALHILLQLCDATGEAHARGIVHRDLKPDNIMLVRRGEDADFVKVLDFGIARVEWGQKSLATAAGLIFGTARYISPEGAQGEIVGPAGDVYSLATMLYQMLAGRTPFEGAQAVHMLIQQIHDTPPPLTSWPGAHAVPPAIAKVVMANLAKAPEGRAEDGRAFGRALLEAARASGVDIDSVRRPTLVARGTDALASAPDGKTSKHGGGARLGELPPVAASPAASATVRWAPTASANDTAPPEATRTVDATLDDEPAPRGARARPADSTKERADVPRRPSARDDLPSPPSLGDAHDGSSAPASERLRARPTGVVVFVVFLLVGALGALAVLWQSGRFGDTAQRDAWVARSLDTLHKNQFDAPPGDNVRELTSEGLRRWPSEQRLIDIRVRAATELLTRSVLTRQNGDVERALALAQLAAELDTHEDAARQLIEAYTSELASMRGQEPPAPLSPPPPTPAKGRPGAANGRAKLSPPAETDPRGVLDADPTRARPGQTVQLTARVRPASAAFEEPELTITGPGLGAGVHMAAAPQPRGVFTASYAFLEPGAFEVVFTVRTSGQHVRVSRRITVGDDASPPSSPPLPAPSGSAKWM